MKARRVWSPSCTPQARFFRKVGLQTGYQHLASNRSVCGSGAGFSLTVHMCTVQVRWCTYPNQFQTHFRLGSVCPSPRRLSQTKKRYASCLCGKQIFSCVSSPHLCVMQTCNTLDTKPRYDTRVITPRNIQCTIQIVSVCLAGETKPHSRHESSLSQPTRPNAEQKETQKDQIRTTPLYLLQV